MDHPSTGNPQTLCLHRPCDGVFIAGWVEKHRSEQFMNEIITATEVAAMLKISKRQVYELAKEIENPIPSIRIRTSVRFRRSDVDGWVDGLVQRKAA